MRLRWPKTSVRGLMIAVAVVALMIGVPGEIGRRRSRFTELARQHAMAREEMHKYMETMTATAPVQFFGDRASVVELISRHGRLKVKYEEAARHPWLPVGPD